MNKYTLTHYHDRNGKIGLAKDIEDSPVYNGHYHREFEKEMKNREKMEEAKKQKSQSK